MIILASQVALTNECAFLKHKGLHRVGVNMPSCPAGKWGVGVGSAGVLGVQGDQADRLGALGKLCPQALEFFLPRRPRPSHPPTPNRGRAVSGHRDKTGLCHEEGSCVGGWAEGYVQRGPEAGAAGRPGQAQPVTSCTLWL